ncbi:MAG: malectin domain-containing carbohydrate-binding protein, partial [Acidimicrobiia bacterium]
MNSSSIRVSQGRFLSGFLAVVMLAFLIPIQTAQAAPGDFEYRVNAGGPDLTTPDPDILGLTTGDLTVISGLTVTGGPGQNTTTNTIELSGVDPDLPEALFQTVLTTSTEAGFAFTVPNGVYEVRLHFAEHFFTSAGSREFDVELEDDLVLDNYDAFVAAGGQNIATTETFEVGVSDGVLNVDLIADVSVAAIRGIEIVEAEDTTPPVISLNGDATM